MFRAPERRAAALLSIGIQQTTTTIEMMRETLGKPRKNDCDTGSLLGIIHMARRFGVSVQHRKHYLDTRRGTLVDRMDIGTTT